MIFAHVYLKLCVFKFRNRKQFRSRNLSGTEVPDTFPILHKNTAKLIYIYIFGKKSEKSDSDSMSYY